MRGEMPLGGKGGADIKETCKRSTKEDQKDEETGSSLGGDPNLLCECFLTIILGRAI
jgi:hypothetical protein